MGVRHVAAAAPGLLAGASPWTYAAIGIGVVIVLLVLALVLVEWLE